MGAIIGKLSRLSLSEEFQIKREPDIPKCTIVANEDMQTPQREYIADQMLDPRSATIGIRRTPLILTNLAESQRAENTTPLKAPTTSYLETDLDEAVEAKEMSLQEDENELKPDDDVDSEVKEVLEDKCESPAKMAPEKCVKSEEESEFIRKNLMNYDDEIITTDGKIMSSPAINKVKKVANLIYEDDTPTSESTPIKPKNGRTPLALVSNNSSPIRSPMGGKPWRGFHEERIRLGLENTPQNAGPFLEKVQSAPGKVGARRAKLRARANWAQDESLII